MKESLRLFKALKTVLRAHNAMQQDREELASPSFFNGKQTMADELRGVLYEAYRWWSNSYIEQAVRYFNWFATEPNIEAGAALTPTHPDYLRSKLTMKERRAYAFVRDYLNKPNGAPSDWGPIKVEFESKAHRARYTNSLRRK